MAIEDGRIVEVGPGLDGDEAVDCSGATLLPGLFDCHMHVMFSSRRLGRVRSQHAVLVHVLRRGAEPRRRRSRTGITTVRDAGGADPGVKQAVDDGLVAGPADADQRHDASARPAGHGDGWLRSGDRSPSRRRYPGMPSGSSTAPTRCARKVRELIRAGADVIKVATSGGVLSPDDDPRHPHFRARRARRIVAEAAAAGILVMAHAQGAEGIKNAVRAGVRSIDHGIFLDDEGIELMLERGTWLVPTLVAPRA